jgi:hypothetical protein
MISMIFATVVALFTDPSISQSLKADHSCISVEDTRKFLKYLARRDLESVSSHPDFFHGQKVKVCGNIRKDNGPFWMISDRTTTDITDDGFGITAYRCGDRPLKVMAGRCVEGYVRRRDGLSDQEAKVSASGGFSYILVQDCTQSELLPE